jgi:hypothetical protein
MSVRFRTGRGASLCPAFALALGLVFVARDARAVDPFEIQIYDGTANPPGTPGLELHLNRVFDGVKTAEAPELPLHRQTHLTLEPSYGVLPFLELGGYFQTTLRADGGFDYAGTKLRAKFVTPEGWHEHLRLGVNFELSLLPERYDRGRWGGEVRPIAAWEDDRWLLAVNPVVSVSLAGPESTKGPSFEPAGMVKAKLDDVLAAGLEYYSDLGPVARFAARDAQQHYVYEVIDVLALPHVELSFGVGQGLTPESSRFIGKVILGYAFESAAKKE